MTAVPDWRGSLEEILRGIERELDGPEPSSAVLEDIKVRLDNVRNVIQAYGGASNAAESLKQLRGIRMRRSVGVCQNVLADIRAGRAPAETSGLAELREVLDDMTERLNIGDGG